MTFIRASLPSPPKKKGVSMKKIRFPLVLLLLFLVACARSPRDQAAKELGLNLAYGEEISSFDTHSGNGDGTTFLALKLHDDAVEASIRSDHSWQSFPLDRTAQTLVYGRTDGTDTVGPYLCDTEGHALVPKIHRGYYTLIDRQTTNEKTKNADLLARHSLNFTIGLYDSDTKILYYYKLDT